MLGTLQRARRSRRRPRGRRRQRTHRTRLPASTRRTPVRLTFATDETYLAAALRDRKPRRCWSMRRLPRRAARKPLLVVENARAALAQLLAASTVPPCRADRSAIRRAVDRPDARRRRRRVRRRACVRRRGVRAIGGGSVIGAGAYVGAGVDHRRIGLAASARSVCMEAAWSAIASCCTRAA